ncbi:MAG: glycosyltransferase family 39 protein [Armatimonadota bacterium]
MMKKKYLPAPDNLAKSRFTHIIFLMVVLWLGCFYGLGAAGVFDLDEGLYTTVSRQMADSGDWLIPKIGTQVFFDKPPLLYWLQAGSIKLLGPTSFAVRLPSAVAAALTALSLLWWARRRGLERTGWLAAVVFAFSTLTIGLSRQAITDSLLTLWFTLSVIGWTEGNRGKRWGYILMAAAAGFATMTKGTIGVLLPGAAFVVRMVIMRDFRELKRVPWIGAIGLYLLIVLPWHLALWRVNGSAFINEYIVHQQIARFLGKDFAHNQPFWFYLPILLIGAFPWSAVMPIAWWQGIRSGRSNEKDTGEWTMWAIWAAVVIGFFSISASKLPGYVQPALPALSILAARRLLDEKTKSLARLECVLAVIGGMLLGGIFTSAGVLGKLLQSQASITLGGKPVPSTVADALVVMYPFALSTGILFLCGTVFIVLRRKVVPQIITAGALTGAVFAMLAGGIGLPAWSGYNIDPLHTLAGKTIPALERGEKLIVYHFERRRPSLLFVTGRADRVIEIDSTDKPNEPEVLEREISQAERGYILAERSVDIPSLGCTLRRKSTAGRWVLWQFAESDKQ